MPFDKKEPLSGYLHNVLRDGAKPFRYRSAVRTLLGLLPVENKGGLSFLQSLPPVGFRYSNNPSVADGFSRYSSSSQRQDDFYVSSNSDVSETGAVDSLKDSSLPAKKVAATCENFSCHGDPGTSETGQGRPKHTVVHEHRQQKAKALNKKIVSKVASEHGSSNVEFSIPGKSTQKQHFPALKPSMKNGDKTIEENSPLTNSLNFQVSGGKEIDLIKGTPAVHQQGKQPRPLELLHKKSPQKTVRSETQEQRAETTILSSGKRHDEAIHGKDIVFSRPESDQVPAGFGATMKNGLKTSIPVEENASRLASATLDQLRQSVHSLVAKVAKPEEKVEDQNQQIVQPQVFNPSRELVIFRQPANRSRVPHAFWERSYLGRLHLNILR